MQLVEPIRNRDDIQLMKRILKRDSLRNYFLFSLGLNTGMRISDFIGLRVNDVLNRKHIEVIEKKTGKTRRFKVNFELQQDIHEYVEGMANTDYLFPSKKTKEPISRVQAYRILRKAADRAGLQSIGTHSMRKSLGYHFYNQTKDVAILQEIFNHSTPQITKRYIGIRQDEIDESLDDFYL
ncbi:integrase [Bacillaceae bacterium JMAK1]|nr:integrase [Bacillaceae bacterium JMAK1]